MTLIRLYRIDLDEGTGWSLEPWHNVDAQTIEYYAAPDGINVVTDRMDESTILMLTDHKGEACGISERYGRPVLYSVNLCGANMIVLQPVDKPSQAG